MRLDQRRYVFSKHRMPVAPTPILFLHVGSLGNVSTGDQTFLINAVPFTVIRVGATALRLA
ncbi:hypothetical protein KDA_41130 [Dictyobacter alpinus]|uniref:Uncharacterized protein n=1 Tax=Dictyobacter alpinus TaxID=2014873 RepID=A0A402BBB8_9CHLR|nr:hypothetical protein KDA_41130 [Dictyobacter alpinus]